MGKLEKVTERIDEDGVVQRTAEIITITKLPQEPAYIKLYIDDIGRMMGLQDGFRDILLYVAASVGYDGFVTLTAGRKARIAATVPCAPRSVDNAITEFIKQGLLHREARCEYQLDPRIFARGEWANIRDRRTAFVAAITYSQSGRSIRTRAISKDEADRLALEDKGQQRLTD